MNLKLGPICLLVFTATLIAVHGSDEATPTVVNNNLDVELGGLAGEALKKLTEKAEAHVFEAEVDKMMKIIINSLYKNKEIFLRELISNASDALDKIRILSLSDTDQLNSNTELQIYIKADKDNKQLIIRDSGVGMTKNDLLKNLGTIAKSGTSDFLSKFQSAKTDMETSDLIGQFGVGFYSAFLVADKITVISKHNEDDQYIWESDSTSYSLTKDPRGNTLKRGTEIILHLKEEAQDYLKDSTLKEISKKYSQFINFPIFLWQSEKRMVEEEPTEEEKAATEKKEEEEGVTEEAKKADTPKKKVEKVFWEWKQINSQKPIWKRSPSDVKEEEYKEFFKAISPRSYEETLTHTHFKAEGDVNFNAILYIPTQVYGDAFSSQDDSREKAIIRLYVRRVFITDEIQDLIPRYLSFLRGVVDSEDLPLNVSRETLQQNKLLKLIKKKIIRKVLEMIQKMDKETFDKFWAKYSVNMKVGIYEDKANAQRIAKLLRFHTTVSTNGTNIVTLPEYVKRMKKGQKKIFYMPASSVEEAMNSPHTEKARKMGYEVLLLVDSVDEYMMSSLNEFDDKKFQSLAKEGAEFYETEESKAAFENLKTEYEPLVDWLSKTALSEKISKAVISNVLTDSPCALTAPEYGWTGSMERIMMANAFKSREDTQNSYKQNQKRILELNPRHPLIKELKQLVALDSDDVKAKEMALMLLDTATLRSGFFLQDTVDFARRIELVMRNNLGISEDAKTEEDPHFVMAPEVKTEEESSDSAAEEDKEAKIRNVTECPTCRKTLSVAKAAISPDEDDQEESDDDAETGEDEEESEDEEEETTEDEETVQEDDYEEPVDEEDESELDEQEAEEETLDDEEEIEQEEGEQEEEDEDESASLPTGRRLHAAAKKPAPGADAKSTPKKPAAAAKKPLQPAAAASGKKGKAKPAPPAAPSKTGKAGSKKVVVEATSKVMAGKKSVGKATTMAPPPKAEPRSAIYNDHDCDGIPDDEDEDVDNDGLLDRTQDSDWDGTLNTYDDDDDNDGIPDELDEDANGDGIPDCRSDTSDLQYVIRFRNKRKAKDSDMDGIPDDADLDDDENGIPDALEDYDGDQIPDSFAITQRELGTKSGIMKANKKIAQKGWGDRDCDGIPDSLDPDDDNDGYFDRKQDSDRDGHLNEWDDDDDNDGIPDSEDPDSNGDGKPECILRDLDNDGIPDHIDTDDDNDGVPDFRDPKHPFYNFFLDSDNDGIPDSLDQDDDNDGIPDKRDYDADGDGSSDYFQDSDGDGVPDTVDDDMDNDGIADHLQDHDCDGIPDLIDPDDDNDGYFDSKQDSDNDGQLNEWDKDDDNDGIPDDEDEDSNGDKIIDCQPVDSDGDGIPDHLDEDDDNDGIPDHLDPDSWSFLLYKNKRALEALPVEKRLRRIEQQMIIYRERYPNGYDPEEAREALQMLEVDQAQKNANSEDYDLGDPGDKDCDGVPDDMDEDMDNDARLDRTQDSDWDGDLNAYDLDDDNDGIPDSQDPDANGDGIPDCRRNEAIKYKVIKGKHGKVRKLVKIRQHTEEEQELAIHKDAAKLKINQVKNMKTAATSNKKMPATAKTTGKVLKPAPTSNVTTKNTKKQAAKTKPAAAKEEKPAAKPAAGKAKAQAQTDKKSAAAAAIKKAVPPVQRKLHMFQEIDQNPMARTLMSKKKTTTPAPPPVDEDDDEEEEDDEEASSGDGDENDEEDEGDIFDEIEAEMKAKAAKDSEPGDTDGDGIPDDLEGDSDGDGIPDFLEDADGDGIPDYQEDSDGDGIPDYQDDSDGDGIPDYNESEPVPTPASKKSASAAAPAKKPASSGKAATEHQQAILGDSKAVGIKTPLSSSGSSGKNKRKQQPPPAASLLMVKQKFPKSIDKDGDGIPDMLEDDDDGDGIPDYMEDEDNDGIPDYLEDEDNDGIPDYLEDDDGDGIPNFMDEHDSSDNTPIKTRKLSQADGDGDGIPDYLEDDDGDGIPNFMEDKDGDNIPDYLDNSDDRLMEYIRKLKLPAGLDNDKDGIPDIFESDADSDGVPDYLEDENNDGIPDVLVDEDSDGIPDIIEKSLAKQKAALKKSKKHELLDEDNNQMIDFLEKKDSDKDGVPDWIDTDDDNDGIPDSKDIDDDGDGILDIHEDENKDGTPDHLEQGDSDGDGIIDLLDIDDDNDGIPDHLDEPLAHRAPQSAQPAAKTKTAPPPLTSVIKKKPEVAVVDEEDEPDNEPEVKVPAKQAGKAAAKLEEVKPPVKEQKVVEDEDDDDEEDEDEDGDGDGSNTRQTVLKILRKLEDFFGVEEEEDAPNQAVHGPKKHVHTPDEDDDE